MENAPYYVIVAVVVLLVAGVCVRQVRHVYFTRRCQKCGRKWCLERTRRERVDRGWLVRYRWIPIYRCKHCGSEHWKNSLYRKK